MFSALAETPESPDAEVRIWTANLDLITVTEFETLNSYLSPAEQERAARFHFETDQRSYILSRALLRCLIAETLGIAAAEIVFEYGAKGKPRLSPDQRRLLPLCFNLTHSSGRAMFALAADREVGIDLESAARLGKELDALAKRILSPREFDCWRALSDPDTQRSAFLRAWTRKESYAKAIGEGIFDQLQQVELILDAEAPEASTRFGNWMVYDLIAPAGFTAALTVASGDS